MRLLENPIYQRWWEKAGFKREWTETGYKIGLNMEPYRDRSAAGWVCPCKKDHVLDAKEVVVDYKNGIWAYHCALAEAIQDSSKVVMELIGLHDVVTKDNHRLTVQNAQVGQALRTLAIMIETNLNHEEHCALNNPAAAMRGGEMKCCCNVNEAKRKIDHIIANLSTVM